MEWIINFETPWITILLIKAQNCCYTYDMRVYTYSAVSQKHLGGKLAHKLGILSTDKEVLSFYETAPRLRNLQALALEWAETFLSL